MTVVKACQYGHEMTPANSTMVQGYPRCKACARDRNRSYQARNRVPVSFDGAVFDAQHRPHEPVARVCCARCRRGTKQYAVVDVCGFNGRCKCHG